MRRRRRRRFPRVPRAEEILAGGDVTPGRIARPRRRRRRHLRRVRRRAAYRRAMVRVVAAHHVRPVRPAGVKDPMAKQTITLKVNGEAQKSRCRRGACWPTCCATTCCSPAPARLRTGVCGACSVLVDGQVVKSCLMLAVQAKGLRHHHRRRPRAARPDMNTPAAMLRRQRVACSCNCTPGFLMAATALLVDNPNPTGPRCARSTATCAAAPADGIGHLHPRRGGDPAWTLKDPALPPSRSGVGPCSTQR